MSPVVVLSLLGAALLHAAWNAILRGGSDRLWSVSAMAMIGAAVALPVALALPPPAPASWPYLAGSALVQLGYSLLLVRAYRHGQLAQVYPIARGTAPLIVAIGAAAIAGEAVGAAGLAGVGLVCAGIVTLGTGRDRLDGGSTLAALACGVCIAAYMVTDGIGARASGGAIGYAAWQAVVVGVLLPAAHLAVRRRLPALPHGRAGALVALAALFGVVGYGVAIWAMSRAPMARVSALRETSILFAAAIGAVFLREPVTPRRVGGGAAIAAGAIVLAGLA